MSQHSAEVIPIFDDRKRRLLVFLFYFSESEYVILDGLNFVRFGFSALPPALQVSIES